MISNLLHDVHIFPFYFRSMSTCPHDHVYSYLITSTCCVFPREQRCHFHVSLALYPLNLITTSTISIWVLCKMLFWCRHLFLQHMLNQQVNGNPAESAGDVDVLCGYVGRLLIRNCEDVPHNCGWSQVLRPGLEAVALTQPGPASCH